MAFPFDIRGSDEFEISWQKYSYEVGPRWQMFDESVLAAVDALLQNGPGYGRHQGDARYSVPLINGYELVYEWTTDRDARGNAGKGRHRE